MKRAVFVWLISLAAVVLGWLWLFGPKPARAAVCCDAGWRCVFDSTFDCHGNDDLCPGAGNACTWQPYNCQTVPDSNCYCDGSSCRMDGCPFYSCPDCCGTGGGPRLL